MGVKIAAKKVFLKKMQKNEKKMQKSLEIQKIAVPLHHETDSAT